MKKLSFCVFIILFSSFFLLKGIVFAAEGSFLIFPLENNKSITCEFGCYLGHKGTDYSASIGTNVIAAADGKVIDINNDFTDNQFKENSYGNFVKIDHQNGYITIYAHLKKDSIKVNKGKDVKRGDIIAETDNSGDSTGPHLHFEVREKGEDGTTETAVNPYANNLWVKNEDGKILTIQDLNKQVSPSPPSQPSQPQSQSQSQPPSQPQSQPQPSQPSPPAGLTGGDENLSFWEKVAFYWNGLVANVKDLFGGSTGEVQIARPLTQTEIQQQADNKSASSATPVRNDDNANEKPFRSQPSQVWNQKFISYKLQDKDKDNGIYQLTLRFQNTGNTTWTKDDVSLNVVGGYQGTAAKFYHQSWTTKLRPTKLTTTINPGDIATFIFTLQFPKDPGAYYPQFQPVRYIKDTNSFSWIGTDRAIFLAEVKQSSPNNLTFAGASVAEIISNNNNNNAPPQNTPPQSPSPSPPKSSPPNNTSPPTEPDTTVPSEPSSNNPTPPEPSFTYFPQREYQGTKFVAKGESITFDATNIDLNSFDSKSIHYEWDFGDREENKISGGKEVQKVNHIYSAPGNYTVILKIKDEKGKEATFTKTITVKKLTVEKEWETTFRGTASDVEQTIDGEYIVIGTTSSYGVGKNNIWLIKVDSNGNEVWAEKKTFGESNNYYWSAWGQQTSDGGYIITGYTDQVLLIIKADADGNEEKRIIIEPPYIAPAEGPYQGMYLENGAASSVQQTSDGGYIIAGHAYHTGLSYSRAWLIKLNSNLEVEWKDKVFEIGSFANSVQQTIDGGYVFVSLTYRAYDTNKQDVLLIKTDSNGDEELNKVFEGPQEEGVGAVQQTSDGGYIIVASTYSYGAGGSDMWLIKTDSDGNKIWDKTFGGEGNDWANSIQQTEDGGYIIVGGTYSYGAGESDILVIKTDANGNELWDKTFGGGDSDYGVSVQQVSDGGYILVGNSNNDILLIKLSPETPEE